MKALLLIVLAVVVVGAGLRAAGQPLPLIDYPIGPIGIDGGGPAMPDVELEAPGYGDFSVP